MSDRNGTPGFYENTLRHFTALSTRRFGTKMTAVGTKLERQGGGLGQRLREVANGPRHALAPQAKYPNFVPTLFQLCSNFVPMSRRIVFSKYANFRGGSIAVAHMVHGPQWKYSFAPVTRVFVPTLFQLCSNFVPMSRRIVFSKYANFRGGSIAVAHMVHGPH